MRHKTIATLILGAALLSGGLSLSAQTEIWRGRLDAAADQLKRSTVRLADRTLQDLLRSGANPPGEIEQALLAQQIDSAAAMLVELIQNRRPAGELRIVASALTEMSRRTPSFSSQGALWRQVQNQVADVNRELGGGFPGRGVPGPVIGRVAWRGVVDDRVHLVIRGRTVEVRTISGAPRPEGAATFTSPLPNSPVDVDVTKTSGRGTVRVLQQPSRANEFTAVVEIYDSPGGAQEYRLDIYWR